MSMETHWGKVAAFSFTSAGSVYAEINGVCREQWSHQITDDSTFTSNGVTKKMKYIDHNFFAFEARDLILTFSENSIRTNF